MESNQKNVKRSLWQLRQPIIELKPNNILVSHLLEKLIVESWQPPFLWHIGNERFMDDNDVSENEYKSNML